MSTIYLTEPGSVLQRSQGRLVVTRGGDELLNVPAVNVGQVVVLAGCNVSTPALAFLADRGISLVLLSGSGRFRGRLSGDLSKNVALRRQQYRRLDDEAFRLEVARSIVTGKLINCRVRCRELSGPRPEPDVKAELSDLGSFIGKSEGARTRAELTGIEGAATRRYFSIVRRSIRSPWEFRQRARRPPPDPVNALFSLLSTCLHGTCHGAIEVAGLDPHGGFLHEERYGRSSLALDLMEEFRPVIADATVLTLLNRRMVSPDHFTPVPEGGVRLTKEGWRIVMSQWDRRLHEQVAPRPGEPPVSYARLITLQARHLRDVIEGTAPGYVPFRAR